MITAVFISAILLCLTPFIVHIWQYFSLPKFDQTKCACCGKVFAEKEPRTGLMFCGSASFCLSCIGKILKGR